MLLHDGVECFACRPTYSVLCSNVASEREEVQLPALVPQSYEAWSTLGGPPHHGRTQHLGVTGDHQLILRLISLDVVGMM